MTTVNLRDFFRDLDSCEDKHSSTHGLHPYPAKFIPHIPRALIEAYTNRGDVVIDPMCGSGTSVVEATLNGRVGLGGDINPISTLIARAKTLRMSELQFEELEAFARVVDAAADSSPRAVDLPDFRNRDHWFSETAAAALAECVALVGSIADQDVRTVARCALSAIIVPVSRQDSETRWVRVEREPSREEVLRRFGRKLRVHLECSIEYSRADPEVSQIWLGDARRLPLADRSAHLIVTSPPYANSHDYYLYHKLRMFWLGYDVRPVQDAEFGSRNKHSDRKMSIAHYLDAMSGVLEEAQRVLREDGRACIVVGDAVIRGEFFDMGPEIQRLGDNAGLKVEDHFTFDQKRYTRAFTRGFGTGAAKSTHVLVFANRPG